MRSLSVRRRPPCEASDHDRLTCSTRRSRPGLGCPSCRCASQGACLCLVSQPAWCGRFRPGSARRAVRIRPPLLRWPWYLPSPSFIVVRLYPLMWCGSLPRQLWPSRCKHRVGSAYRRALRALVVRLLGGVADGEFALQVFGVACHVAPARSGVAQAHPAYFRPGARPSWQIGLGRTTSGTSWSRVVGVAPPLCACVCPAGAWPLARARAQRRSCADAHLACHGG